MRLAAALVVTLTACATAKPKPWVPATTPFTSSSHAFEVAVPAGWMRANLPDRDVLVLTRDGTPLQRIVVRAIPLGKPIGMGKSSRVVTADMSPQELAEVALDDLQSGAATNVQVVENAPATLDARRGFRMIARRRERTGLATRIALYGVASTDRFYLLMYLAPERHYFALDLPTFDDLARTFTVKAIPPPSA